MIKTMTKIARFEQESTKKGPKIDLDQFINSIELLFKRAHFIERIFYILLILSTLLVIFSIKPAIYFVWILLGFGWCLYFFESRLNIIEHLLLSFAVFSTLFTVFISFFAILSIPVNIIMFIALYIASIIFFINRKIFKDLNTEISSYDLMALLLLWIAFIAKVSPLFNHYTQSLHDPISHSKMAYDLVKTGLIEYFYSPGLHIVSAFGNLANGFDVSKQVYILSAIYSAYSGIVAYISLKHFTRNKIWSLITATFFSVGYYPAFLAFSAGKNSFIMALPLLFLMIFSIDQYFRTKSFKVTIISILTIAGLFITHYPIAILGAIYIVTKFLINIKHFKFKDLILLIGFIYSLLWIYRSYQYQIEISDELANPERTSVYYNLDTGNSIDSIRYFFEKLSDQIKVDLLSWNRYPTILAILSLPIAFLISLKRSDRKIKTIFLWSVINLLFFAILSAFKMSVFTILIESYIISIFIFVYIFTGFIITYLYQLFTKYFLDRNKWQYIITGALLTSMVFLGYLLYQQTKSYVKDAHNVVTSDDIKVFEWIDENFEDNKKILINAHMFSDIIFSSDAGGYIEIFTDNKISTPFYEYDRIDTYENYQLYIELSKDITNCEIREELIDKGFNYYYQGEKQPYSKPLIPQNKIGDYEEYDLVYNSGKSYLFKIENCE